MKLLCDAMLKGLARWLRAAGYDTELPRPDESDRDIIERARHEGRWLVTRDRKLLEFRHADETVRHLQANSLDDCVVELSARLSIDWQYRPFSRCLLCNRPLEPVPEARREAVPVDVRDQALWQCPACGRLYWEGSHVRRMRHRLEDFTRKIRG
ncbi:uncharacterized protein FOKN1_1180 [Thiohalobacter thiocyanaticus]|uniref:Mut7-C RNAse domain-containing protein n=1 Tax=Thiohalobacter thiocyanaticus TaxID=585455 RepID=A0A1Z4VPM5_9GAMM|nr:DUF5615 family PIN-like protein [Thiohalobacter thiocyanaticus]BAZ93579.1 uncharacterized protein FOKN1_1180 [Thiohalobacter thiocyanaticus]